MDGYARKEVIGKCTLYLANNAAVLPSLTEIHSCVTDPPYHLTSISRGGSPRSNNPQTPYGRTRLGEKGFMGKTWDGGDIAFRPELWMTVADTLLPGGHLLSFSGPRTYHRMTCAIEDAGFDIRDQIMWVFGSGFPKSLNLEGEWQGWGTALKPAHEPICLARKPFNATVAANVAEHGTGALNIAQCRVPSEGGKTRLGEASQDCRYTENGATSFAMLPGPRGGDPQGRWPANLIHDGSDEVRSAFPQADGQQAMVGPEHGPKDSVNVYGDYGQRQEFMPRVETDKSAARFFYCAKASKKDRDEGLEDMPRKQQDASRKEGNPGGDNPRNRGLALRANHHPTVKPTSLMQYLCRLVTPPGGTVLDPFMGSGSTGKAAVLEGFSFIGIEQDPDYFDIACRRVAAAYASRGVSTIRTSQAEDNPTELPANSQLSLFGAA